MAASPARLCGIGGILPVHPLAATTVSSMWERMAHRGPDDRGWTRALGGGFSTGGHSPKGEVKEPLLVHCRLSILDLSKAGHQPMFSADGKRAIVYNGEVYNYLELRAELEADGHRFATGTDTEVVLAALDAWGTDALKRFVGMFAIAVIDLEARTLLLARDFFGIKPLYWCQTPSGFAFASDIPTLLEVPWVPRTADPERVHLYLTTPSGISSFGDRTLLSQVRQVPAAHWMKVPLDDPAAPVVPVRYWDPWPGPVRDVPYDEAVAEVRRLFLESVRLHLRSDVAVGTALSGGIDSSAIVMAMRHLVGSDLHIHAFSYIPDDPRISEERFIDLVGKAAGATVHKVRPQPEDLVADLERLVEVQGEPFGTTSIYAQYRVFAAAHEAGVKVMLDGQGADEILAGYRHYLAARRAGMLARGRFGADRRMVKAVQQHGAGRAALDRQTAAALVPGPVRRTLAALRLVDRHRRPPWLHHGWFRARRVRPRPLPNPTGRDALRRRLHLAVTERSLPQLLRYEDRDSMAWSVESRVPFLVPDLAHYLLSLPDEHLIGPDGQTKRVFRDAMRGLVPDEVLDRQDKIGFYTTESDWLQANADWVESVLQTADDVPFLRADRILATWRAIRLGAQPYDPVVWRWLNLLVWARRFGVRWS